MSAVPALEGGVDDGRVGFGVSPLFLISFMSSDFIWPSSMITSHFELVSTLALSSVSSLMLSSLISSDCFRSLSEAGGDMEEQLEDWEATTRGEEGFWSCAADVEASESLVFVVLLSVSMGSIHPDTSDEQKTTSFTQSFPESSAGSSIGVSFS